MAGDVLPRSDRSMLDFRNRYDVDKNFSVVEYFASPTSFKTESTALPQYRVSGYTVAISVSDFENGLLLETEMSGTGSTTVKISNSIQFNSILF